MLRSIHSVVDYAAVERKLRRYFTDTSPISVDVCIAIGGVIVTTADGHFITSQFTGGMDATGIVTEIVRKCENRLYPCIISSECTGDIKMSDNEIVAFVKQGYSHNWIREEISRRNRKTYIIIRLNITKDTIDYMDKDTNEVYRAHCHIPVLLMRSRIANPSWEDKNGELYSYIVKNSEVEKLGIRKIWPHTY